MLINVRDSEQSYADRYVVYLAGGLTAVIYTDTLQAVLMIGGALALMAKGC